MATKIPLLTVQRRARNSASNQVYYKRDLPSAAKARVKLNLTGVTGVPKGKYSLELHKVGYNVNDACVTNLDLGSPPQLAKAQVA